MSNRIISATTAEHNPVVSRRAIADLQTSLTTARRAHAAACNVAIDVTNTILAANVYLDDDGERVTNASNHYAICEADFAAYMDAEHAEYVRRGIEHARGYVYEEPYRLAVIAAENALIDACAGFCPASARATLPAMRTHWRHRPDLVSLCMRLDPASLPARARGEV